MKKFLALLLALAPARAALAAAGDDDSARWQWDDLQIAGILSLADALRQRLEEHTETEEAGA